MSADGLISARSRSPRYVYAFVSVRAWILRAFIFISPHHTQSHFHCARTWIRPTREYKKKPAENLSHRSRQLFRDATMYYFVNEFSSLPCPNIRGAVAYFVFNAGNCDAAVASSATPCREKKQKQKLDKAEASAKPTHYYGGGENSRGLQAVLVTSSAFSTHGGQRRDFVRQRQGRPKSKHRH